MRKAGRPVFHRRMWKWTDEGNFWDWNHDTINRNKKIKITQRALLTFSRPLLN
jgi:hypothetical protein